MTEGLLYLDSSALVKLVLPESETEALISELEDRPERVSSALAVVGPIWERWRPTTRD